MSELKDQFLKVLNGTFFECSRYIELKDNANYFCNLMITNDERETKNISSAFVLTKDKAIVTILSKSYEIDIDEESCADQVYYDLLTNFIYSTVNEKFANYRFMTRKHGADIRVETFSKKFYEYCGKVANDKRSAYRDLTTNEIYLF